MRAFDGSYLEGNEDLRQKSKGIAEKIITLDEQEYEMNTDNLVILRRC